mgnify:CR=1 FL=1
MSLRGIRSVQESRPAIEGAGVRLRRGFGFGQEGGFDPFLLFDDFRGERPDDYRAGFPWHPHRGIETITYVLAGSVEHRDSLGNRGVMKAGELQWMTAGRGIVHQEMPEDDGGGRMHGFQLWANLPSALKMGAPRYQDIRAEEIPEVYDDDGARARVLCGDFWGRRGPADGVAADPRYVDVYLPPGLEKSIKIELDRSAFAYVFEGSGWFRAASAPRGVLVEELETDRTVRAAPAKDRYLVSFDSGDEIRVRAGPEGMRFLLASGRPLGEPIAWHGPIVMNTRDEIEAALRELRDGTFIKA